MRRPSSNGTGNVVRRESAGQPPYNLGRAGAYRDFLSLRELCPVRECPVRGSHVDAPDYNGQPNLSGFSTRAAPIANITRRAFPNIFTLVLLCYRAFATVLLGFARTRWQRHEMDVHLVELLRVQIELHGR